MKRTIFIFVFLFLLALESECKFLEGIGENTTVDVVTPKRLSWMGGNFVQTNSTGVSGVMEFSIGTDDPSSKVRAIGASPKGAAWVNSITSNSDGSKIYFGGNFREIDGVNSNAIIVLDMATMSFSPLQSPPGKSVRIENGIVNATVFWNDTLYIAGDIFAGSGNRFVVNGLLMYNTITHEMTTSTERHSTDACSRFGWGEMTLIPPTSASSSHLTLFFTGRCITSTDGSIPSSKGIIISFIPDISKWVDLSLQYETNFINVEASKDGKYVYVIGEQSYQGTLHFSGMGRITTKNMKWDTLFKFPSQSFNDEPVVISSIAISNSLIYVGGSFNTSASNGDPMVNIACYNETSDQWTSIGSFSSMFTGIRVIVNDMTTIHNGNIVASGNFNQIRNKGEKEWRRVNGVAHYNGSHWNAIGNNEEQHPFPSFIYRLAYSSMYRTLVSVGQRWEISDSSAFPVNWNRPSYFNFTANDEYSPLSKWKSAEMCPGGDCFGFLNAGVISAVVKQGENIYFGGDFAHIAKKAMNSFNVAVYKPRTNEWKSLGENGLANGTINNIFADRTNVYFVGTFNSRYNSNQLNSVAMWDTVKKEWNAMEGGIGLTGKAHSCFSTRTTKVTASDMDSTWIYLAGSFDRAGSQNRTGDFDYGYYDSPSIARWHKSLHYWEFLPVPLSDCGVITALKVNASILYLAGSIEIDSSSKKRGLETTQLLAFDMESKKFKTELTKRFSCPDLNSKINTMKMIVHGNGGLHLAIAGRFFDENQIRHFAIMDENGNLDGLNWGPTLNNLLPTCGNSEMYSISDDPMTNNLFVVGDFGFGAQTLGRNIQLPWSSWDWQRKIWTQTQATLPGWTGNIKSITSGFVSFSSESVESTDNNSINVLSMILSSLILLLAALLVMIFVTIRAFRLRKRMQALFDQDNNLESIEQVTHVNINEIDFDWEKHSADSELGVATWRGSFVSVRRLPIHPSLPSLSSSDFPLLMSKLGELRDKNVLKYFGYLIAEEEVLILTEYFSMGTLSDQLKKNPVESLPWESRVGIIRDVAKGLVYLHSQSVYHLSLNAKVVIPFLIEEVHQRYKIGYPGLWGSDLIEPPTVISSEDAAFMSPELLMEEDPLDPSKCDIYSLGILIANVCLDISLKKMTENNFQHLEKRSSSSNYSNLHSLAFSCLNQNPKSRPTLANILLILGE